MGSAVLVRGDGGADEGYVWMRRRRLAAAGVMVAQIEGYVWMRRRRLAAAGGGRGRR
jgi:hypothetical protein